MPVSFWIKRFLTVLAGAFVLLFAVELLKGHPKDQALSFAGLWGLITAVVFIVARYNQARRKQHCAICRDTPEMQNPPKA